MSRLSFRELAARPISELKATGPHLPYVEYLIANAPRCAACYKGGSPFRTCTACRNLLISRGVMPDIRANIVAKVLEMFPDARDEQGPHPELPDIAAAPTGPAASGRPAPGRPRSAAAPFAEASGTASATAQSCRPAAGTDASRLDTASKGERATLFFLGLVGGIVGTFMGVGSWVEFDGHNPVPAVLLAVGASGPAFAAITLAFEAWREAS